RGHEVDLYEQADVIGGQMNLADKPPFKDHFSLLVPYLRRQIELSGVKLHLNKKITKQDILDMKPDAVICATGLKPASPPIPGAELTVNAKEILAGRNAGKSAVIIGGGSVGCETAEFLAEKGCAVTVIEMLGTLAGNTGKTAQSILLGHLKAAKVNLLTECKVKEITAGGVSYTDRDGAEHFVKADTAILAIGDKPDTSLYDSLKVEIPEIYNIGDSAGGGIIPNAVYDGYTLGCGI
ncbi:MAG: FAD-dependent oxidoreductase, partial [Clostridia bacterium]|nr:FAD-dependent oxidoreductase [Clostridia bacterium]